MSEQNTKCGYSFSSLDRKKNFGNNLLGFAEIFTFSTPAPMIIARNNMTLCDLVQTIWQAFKNCI